MPSCEDLPHSLPSLVLLLDFELDIIVCLDLDVGGSGNGPGPPSQAQNAHKVRGGEALLLELSDDLGVCVPPRMSIGLKCGSEVA